MIPAQNAPEDSSAPAAPDPTDHTTASALTPAQLTARMEKASASAVADFDLDAWIGAVGRPEEDVLLHNPDPAWQERYDTAVTTWQRAEARLAHAQKAEENDAERSITDLGASAVEAEVEAALLELQALIAERDDAALRVRVQQRTPEEVAALHAKARAAGVDQRYGVCYVVADAIVSVHAPKNRGGAELPRFTGEQLERLTTRDTTGFEQFLALRTTVDRISARPTVPSLPGSSTSRGTDGSSAR